jgi:ABC-2 type transport system ATP-binding protein
VDDFNERGAVIRTRDLTKVYRSEITAVDGLDLEVCPGEVFGLLGPNGAGKTTTVGLLTTRVVPTRGSAAVAGVDVVVDPARAKRGIGVVSQVNTLDRKLSVRDNLYFHGRYFGMSSAQARAAADLLLARFRLADRTDADVNTLSGGMARRLMVARAAMHRPAVLFLDEPTAGLDPQSRRALWEEIRTLSAQGTTIFLTTQYLEEAEALTSRVAVIDSGKIVADGSVAELKARHGRTRLDLRPTRTDELARVLASLEGAGASERAGVVHVELDPRRAAREITAIVADLRDQQIELDSIAVRESSLEDVFVHLTGSAIA